MELPDCYQGYIIVDIDRPDYHTFFQIKAWMEEHASSELALPLNAFAFTLLEQEMCYNLPHVMTVRLIWQVVFKDEHTALMFKLTWQ